MEPDLEWTVTRIDGKIASVSNSLNGAAWLMSRLSSMPYDSFKEVSCRKIGTEALFELSDSINWEDLKLFGTSFQLTVWKKLFEHTHCRNKPFPLLMSYSDFAESMGKGPGVRAVAHAVGLNPIPVIIPCHLIIPKETMNRLAAMQSVNLFQWKALYTLDSNIDYGEYALGPALKHKLIGLHLSR